MGNDNNQLVLAEGVEKEEEVSLMESLGVDLFEGYYFRKPHPSPEFMPLFGSNILLESLHLRTA